MRAINKKKRGPVLAAAVVLLALAVRAEVTYGAGGIETDRTDCRITFDLSVHYQEPAASGDEAPDAEAGEPVTGDRFAELNASSIDVDLYRIASVDVSGHYKALNPYQSLEESLSGIDHKTTAQEWMTLAGEAYALAVPGEDGTQTGAQPEKSISFQSTDAPEKRTADGLETGFYLVTAEDVITEEFIYHFTPYLVALPGNGYAPPETEEDSWEYEVTVGLKPGQEERYGDLEIVKTLRSYNETLGGASFIFEIKAVKNGQTVYSDVCSLVFDGPGRKSLKIEGKIPVKAEVTVTEVYSGASYEVSEGTSKEQHPVIEAEKTAAAEFSNTYDHRLNGGSTIVNAFSPRGQEADVWDHEQLKDSTGKSGGN